MFPILSDLFSNLFSTVKEDYHNKKHDIDNESDNDVRVQLVESNSIEDFMEELHEYYESVLEGRTLKYIADLKLGMGRVGDGKESEMFWWAPADHPVGAMLRHNQIEPIVSVEHKNCGEMLVYPDSQVRFCVENIAQLLKEHRSLDLIDLSKSDEEKELTTKVPTSPLDVNRKDD